MTDPLDRVLKLVAEGRLTAEEAAPILDALDSKGKVSSWAFTPDEAPSSSASSAVRRPSATSFRTRSSGSVIGAPRRAGQGVR